MVQSARVVLTAYIGRLRAVLAKIANMPERNAGFCSACSRRFKAFPKIVHSANVVKEIVEPEEALLMKLSEKSSRNLNFLRKLATSQSEMGGGGLRAGGGSWVVAAIRTPG